MAHLARAVEKGAVLASPRKGLIALAQEWVLDGILNVVIVRQVRADLMIKNVEISEKIGCQCRSKDSL